VNPGIKWVSLRCHFCNTRLRIKEAYAHLRGRCPECGARIEAPRPREEPPLPLPSNADEPLGLLPIEEEWPEPAQIEDLEPGASYGIESSTMAPLAKRPVPQTDGEMPSEKVRTRPAAGQDPPPAPYDLLPAEGPEGKPIGAVPDYLMGLEIEPSRPPTWTDRSSAELWIFPARKGNRLVWFFLAFDFMILAGLAAVLARFPAVGPFVVPAGALLGLWIALYASSCFLAIVEETAAGNDQIAYPRGAGLIDGWGRLAYVSWILICAAFPVGVLWANARESLWITNLWWIAALAIIGTLFPVVFFSSMAATSRWLIVDQRMIGSMFRRLHVLIFVWLTSALFAAICVWLGYRLVFQMDWWLLLPPAVGIVWSALLIIYARLLGRSGWHLSQDFPRRKFKKKPARIPVAAVESWGPDPDWDDLPPEKQNE
jgi:hypothetical protein